MLMMEIILMDKQTLMVHFGPIFCNPKKKKKKKIVAKCKCKGGACSYNGPPISMNFYI